MDDDRIERRLAAVERAVSDGAAPSELADAAAAVDTAAERDERIDDLAERVAELEAATQALRGYVGAVRSDEGDVADRAERALTAVSDLEARVETLEGAAERSRTGDDPVISQAPGESETPTRDARAGPSTEERRGETEPSRPERPVGVESDPAWLARADERLPASDEQPAEHTDEDSGLAARLAGLL